MGLLDKAKAAAKQAAIKAKETAGELQAKRELGQAYDQLGQKTFELIEAGEVSAAALEPLAERVRVLKASHEAPEPVGATAAASAADEMPEPPATPTV
jgi:plasmid stabilization system protein ParE